MDRVRVGLWLVFRIIVLHIFLGSTVQYISNVKMARAVSTALFVTMTVFHR